MHGKPLVKTWNRPVEVERLRNIKVVLEEKRSLSGICQYKCRLSHSTHAYLYGTTLKCPTSTNNASVPVLNSLYCTIQSMNKELGTMY